MPEALNLGADAIHTIRELALLIGEITTEVRGEAIEPEFGDEGPTGQIRRGCDTSKLRAALDYRSSVSLRDGLEKTVNWFVDHEDYALRSHP